MSQEKVWNTIHDEVGVVDMKADDDKKYEVVALKEEDLEECNTCLDELWRKLQVKVIPCNHRLHMKCLTTWVDMRGPTCPACRGVVNEQEEMY